MHWMRVRDWVFIAVAVGLVALSLWLTNWLEGQI